MIGGMSRPRVALTLLQCWHRVPGGTASAILALTRALQETGEVDLVGIGPWGTKLPPPPWTPPIPMKRLPLPYQLVYDGWHHVGMPSVERAVRDADVVHATAATVPPKRHKPLIVTIYDLFPLLAPAQFTKRGVRLMTKGIDLARRHADLVLCPSEATLDDCLADGFDSDRLRLVPLGVEPHETTEADLARVRARYALDRPYVLWVGTIEPRKNLPVLIEAFRRLGPRDEDLVIVGPPGWGEELESMVVNIGDRVRHLGFLAAEDLPAIYSGAQVFCFPSLREGFGLPPLEAMSHGVPVIASAATASEEVVGSAGVLVPAHDVDAWTDALRDLLDDAGHRARLSRRGLERARTFTWNRSAALTIDCYREVIG
jgi:glycosyltransferase involved in cell wall biosynthesis